MLQPQTRQEVEGAGTDKKDRQPQLHYAAIRHQSLTVAAMVVGWIGALVALMLSLGYTNQAQRAKALERAQGSLSRRRLR